MQKSMATLEKITSEGIHHLSKITMDYLKGHNPNIVLHLIHNSHRIEDSPYFGKKELI
jgi:hypothetical protein